MTADGKDLESYLEDGYEIKSVTVDAGHYLFALQRGRKAAIVHVDGVDEDIFTTIKSVEVGY